jgi:GDP-L-fucose synthase
MQGHINVGSGSDISIGKLATLVKNVVGYRGAIDYDRTKPDGSPRKLMDSSKLMELGWQPEIELNKGLGAAYADFLQNHLAAVAA